MFDLAKSSVEKEKIQEVASNLATRYDNILLSWATGTSKTKAVIRIIENYYQSYRVPGISDPNFYIMLKETNHKQNWVDEFTKWGKEGLLIHITFFCYASLHKYMHDRVDMLILDECHALSEMREDYLKTIKCDKIISLSATVDKFVKERIKSYKPGFYEYHISLQNAIDKGILPQPTIKVVYIDLDEEEKKYEYPATKIARAKKTYKPRMLTGKELYSNLQKKIDMWEGLKLEDNKQWAHNKWIQAMGKRKKIMATLKTDGLKRLLEILKDKRYICFTGSIDQCRDVGAEYAINSKIPLQRRKRLINAFNNGEIDHIYAVGMLRESMNLNNIEAGIIGQLDNQSGSFFQMAGRSMRAIAPEIYILILRGTKDEEYFDKATKGLSSQYFEDFIWPED